MSGGVMAPEASHSMTYTRSTARLVKELVPANNTYNNKNLVGNLKLRVVESARKQTPRPAAAALWCSSFENTDSDNRKYIVPSPNASSPPSVSPSSQHVSPFACSRIFSPRLQQPAPLPSSALQLPPPDIRRLHNITHSSSTTCHVSTSHHITSNLI